MESKRIFEAQKNISVEIAVHISELDFALDEYLGGFERKDFFTFGDSEKRDKHYKQAYYRFMSGIAELLSSLEDSFARLSSLLISADEAGSFTFCSLLFLGLCALWLSAARSGLNASVGRMLLPMLVTFLPILILTAFCVAFDGLDAVLRIGEWSSLTFLALFAVPLSYFLFNLLFLRIFHRTAK